MTVYTQQTDRLLNRLSRLVMMACLAIIVALISPVYGNEGGPAEGIAAQSARGELTEMQKLPARESPLPADWTTYRDTLKRFGISHPQILKKTDLAGALYAAVGATADGKALALVINRQERDMPPTMDDLKESVDESLKGTTVVRKNFSSLPLAGHAAFMSEVVYEESAEKWYSLVVSLFASGFHYTIAVQASPLPDDSLREDILGAVLSLKLLD